MMPLLWRYIGKMYGKFFLFTFFVLLSLGLILKHKKFILLITNGCSGWEALLIGLCLLSSTLPMLLGFSTLIASFLTTYKLNISYELTSLRSFGLKLGHIFFPLYFFAVFFTIINFGLVSISIPYIKLALNKLYLESRHTNPLFLLRQKSFPLLKHSYMEMDFQKSSSSTKNILLAFRLHNESPLSLFVADKLSCKDDIISLKNVTLISYIHTHPQTFDHLIIDSEKECYTPKQFFISLFEKSAQIKHWEGLSLKQLWHHKYTKLARQEFFQKISKSFFPLSVTFLGLTLGIFIGKAPRYRDFIIPAFLMLFYFLTFFGIKHMGSSLFLCGFYALIPHILISLYTTLRMHLFNRGVV